MIIVRLRITIKDLGFKKVLAHVGSRLFAIEYLNLWHVVQISFNRLLFHLLILLLYSFLCLSVKWALRLQYLNLNFLRNASQVLIATTFTFADASPTLEEASIARSLEDRCANHHLLMLLLLDRLESSST